MSVRRALRVVERLNRLGRAHVAFKHPDAGSKVDKSNFAITSSFIVPALGCWEVTGHFHGKDLKVVIDVK